MTPLSRREFLGAVGGAAGLVAIGGLEACSSGGGAKKPPPSASATAQGVGGITDPSKAPFDTVVVLMMENRSFDHLLGWVPGADGKQAGLSYPAFHGGTARTAALAVNTQACGDKDPAHDWQSMVKHYNNGKMDGWLQTQTTGDHFPIGYYEEAQVPILGALATSYTLFDAYHCSLTAATWPNRFYMLCAATDVDETGGSYPATVADRPSKIELAIFDRVRAAGLTTGYYNFGEPMTGLFQSAK